MRMWQSKQKTVAKLKHHVRMRVKTLVVSLVWLKNHTAAEVLFINPHRPGDLKVEYQTLQQAACRMTECRCRSVVVACPCQTEDRSLERRVSDSLVRVWCLDCTSHQYAYVSPVLTVVRHHRPSCLCSYMHQLTSVFFPSLPIYLFSFQLPLTRLSALLTSVIQLTETEIGTEMYAKTERKYWKLKWNQNGNTIFCNSVIQVQV